jgi:hypothetical protein
MTKPLTQIDDEIREMTDEEFADYEKQQADSTSQIGE